MSLSPTEPAYTELVRTTQTALNLLISCLVALLLGIISVASYRLLLHPLAGIPGPRLAAVSNVWHAYHVREGRMAWLGRTLHRRYGPAVRVGPNEVWFDSKAAFKTIYSNGSGFEKSDFYLATVLIHPRVTWALEAHSLDTLDLLSERAMTRYRMQRRLIGPVYRPSNVIKHEEAVDSVLRKLVPRLRSLQGEEVDLKEWMHLIVVECLGAAVLTWSPGMLDKGTDRGTGSHSYLAWRRKSVLGLFPTVAKLQVLEKKVGRMFSWLWGTTHDAPPRFRPFFPDIGKRVSKRVKAALQGTGIGSDLSADLIQLHLDKPEFTESYLRKMIVTNFGAGHETMASTLISLLATVGSKRDVHDQAAEEIRRVAPLSYAQAASCPYTQAVIKESKRLHPVVSMSLPRRAPASGVHINGFFMPPGTTVGCNPISLHRNSDICGADPDRFDPVRWLRDEQRAREMDLYSLAWGGGARTCPGRHLAEMIVWKIFTAIMANFDVESTLPDTTSPPSYFLFIMTGVRTRFIPKDRQSAPS